MRMQIEVGSLNRLQPRELLGCWELKSLPDTFVSLGSLRVLQLVCAKVVRGSVWDRVGRITHPRGGSATITASSESPAASWSGSWPEATAASCRRRVDWDTLRICAADGPLPPFSATTDTLRCLRKPQSLNSDPSSNAWTMVSFIFVRLGDAWGCAADDHTAPFPAITDTLRSSSDGWKLISEF